jgi:hypothetical protein
MAKETPAVNTLAEEIIKTIERSRNDADALSIVVLLMFRQFNITEFTVLKGEYEDAYTPDDALLISVNRDRISVRLIGA